MKKNKWTPKRVLSIAVLATTAALIILGSCSSEISDPGKAVQRMIDAYGGPEGIDRITSYSGKGFMRRLPEGHVAQSYPFDIYQKGDLFKNRTMNVQSGKLVDVRIVIGTGSENYSWSMEGGRVAASGWEHTLLKYRFPLVLKWLRDSAPEGELLPSQGDGLYRVRFADGDDVITLVISGGSWLLKESLFESGADSSFVSRDVYSDYRDVDGVRFPNRFTGYLGDNKYYEYFLTRIDLDIEIPDGIFSLTEEDTASIWTQPDTSSSR